MITKRLSDSVKMRDFDDFKLLLTMSSKEHLDFKRSKLNIVGFTFEIMVFSETTHLRVFHRDYSLHSEWYSKEEQAIRAAYGIYRGLFQSCFL